ncbi:hypothetical protein NKH18_03035 [Streptomyces sp. M10(2022)]
METNRHNQPYTEGEWRRLEASCTSRMTARRTHRQVLEAAGRGADPSVHGVTFDDLARLWLHAGPAEASRAVERFGRSAGVDRAQFTVVEAALFSTSEPAFAYLTLFAMRTGIVPDGIDALRLDKITRTSPNTVLTLLPQGPDWGCGAQPAP